jgi:undecaprenyl diphosphate synthase
MSLDPQKMPRHIAIIMDGNRRWAKQKKWMAIRGHNVGAEGSHAITRECVNLGIEALTLYTFSTENWRRPRTEVMALMHLIARNLKSQQDEMNANNVRVRHSGLRENLPDFLLRQLDETIESTSGNTGLVLNLAINYGGRAELTQAFQHLAAKVQSGELTPEQIDEDAISAELYTHDLPEPDLLIRTGGEMRISNFLPWQIAYAEFWVTPVMWPDFKPEHLRAAIADFQNRDRRFGGVKD